MRPMTAVERRIHPVNRASAILLAAGLVMTGVLAILPALTKPFTLDETEISTRAHFILQKGPKTFLDGSHYLAHPPLYEYTIAGVFKLFGESEIPARAFGLLLFVLAGVLFKWTIGELLRNEDPLLQRVAAYIGVLLYAVNPLLIQHSMELDADTTGTAFFTMAFAYFFVRMEMRDGVRQWPMRLGQAAAIAFAFLSKEITPFMIFAGVLAYRAAGWQWKKLLQDIFAVFVPGTLAAWGVWWVYCACTGTDVMEFLKYTLFKKTPRALNAEFLGRVWANMGRIIRWPVYWMSFPFFALLLVTACRRLAGFLMTRKTRPEDALWMIAFVVWIPYLLVKGSIDMMKYQHPVYPLFIAAILCGCVAVFRSRVEDLAAMLRDAWWVVPALAAAVIAIVWYYAHIGDYLLLQWDQPYEPRYKQFLNLYYRPLAAGAGAAVVLWVAGRIRIWEGILASSLLFCLPMNAALNLNQAVEYTTAESWMNYGESGHLETVDYLAAIARPGAAAAMRHDLQYYLEKRRNVKGLKFIPLRDVLITRDARILEQFLASGALQIAVMDRISLLGLNPQNSGTGFALFNHYYYLDRTFGNFKIYRPKARRS